MVFLSFISFDLEFKLIIYNTYFKAPTSSYNHTYTTGLHNNSNDS